MPKSARELELIIMRLKSQIEAKNEQIEKTNQYIQEATDQTQKIIVRFRAFCAKILENELAYSRITTRELETMPLEELLARAEVMHRQGQIKSREIYETMKRKLMDKNTVITGLTDQVTQLKVMLDNAADIFPEMRMNRILIRTGQQPIFWIRMHRWTMCGLQFQKPRILKRGKRFLMLRRA